MTPIEHVDAILREVSWRSTVYAHEVLGPLYAAAAETDDLRANVLLLGYAALFEDEVSECNGDRYLHSRDFLNALLDLRNELKETST